MIDREIMESINVAVITAIGLCDTVTADFPVKFPSITFVPPDDQKYLEVVHIPNNSSAPTYWGSERNYAGLVRLVLHWPNENAGAYGPMDVAKSIAAYFQKGRSFTYFKVTDEANFMGILENGTEVLYTYGFRYSQFEG